MLDTRLDFHNPTPISLLHLSIFINKQICITSESKWRTFLLLLSYIYSIHTIICFIFLISFFPSYVTLFYICSPTSLIECLMSSGWYSWNYWRWKEEGLKHPTLWTHSNDKFNHFFYLIVSKYLINTGLFISPSGFPNSTAQQPRQTRQKGAYQ